MLTFTQLKNMFTNLSNNTSTDNTALGGLLINNEHRYLLQKYFDNMSSSSFMTVGGDELTLTGVLSAGAVSATLNAVWTYPTGSQLVVFSNSDQRMVYFTQGVATIYWSGGLTASATASIDAEGMIAINIPANISKITDVTLTVGQLTWTLNVIRSRQDWDRVNFLPYNSDIPLYCYVYGGQVNIWPIPSTTGNTVTLNFKARVPDLTYADYSTGTLAGGGMAVGSTLVTGLATSWNTTGGFPLNANIEDQNLYIRSNPPYGDGIWYPIQSFTSDTTLRLITPVVSAPNISASATYTIGQLPLLQEDFHDMLVYGPLKSYYTSRAPNKEAYAQFKDLYEMRLALLADYAGTSQVNVDLGDIPLPKNPNLYIYANN